MSIADDTKSSYLIKSLDRYILERQRREEEAKRNIKRLCRWLEKKRKLGL